MAMTKNVLLLTFTMALFGISFANVNYTVGDSAGWKSMGFDYAKWASKHHFHVGDTLAFNYNNTLHDVKQVTANNFMHCNGTSPIATYKSGSDKIVLKEVGHQYFICGFPGHCKMGQKVDILVLKKSMV
ncbi:hypothetical protein ACFE04_031658 [Oxalis oulophora]